MKQLPLQVLYCMLPLLVFRGSAILRGAILRPTFRMAGNAENAQQQCYIFSAGGGESRRGTAETFELHNTVQGCIHFTRKKRHHFFFLISDEQKSTHSSPVAAASKTKQNEHTNTHKPDRSCSPPTCKHSRLCPPQRSEFPRPIRMSPLQRCRRCCPLSTSRLLLALQ